MRIMKIEGWAIVVGRGKKRRLCCGGSEAHLLSFTGIGFYDTERVAKKSAKWFKQANKKGRFVKVVPVILEMREVGSGTSSTQLQASMSRKLEGL